LKPRASAALVESHVEARARLEIVRRVARIRHDDAPRHGGCGRTASLGEEVAADV
jgi:hypothetical protein